MITGTRRGDWPTPLLPPSIPALLRELGTGPDRDRIAFRFIDRTTETLASATYAELLGRASFMAGELRRAGVGPGDTVMLLLESRLEFYYALFAAMQLGAIPVAVYPPLAVELLPSSLEHLKRVAIDTGAAAIVTSRALYGVATQVRLARSMAVVSVENAGTTGDVPLDRGDPGDRPVLLQYTSGSLAAPRAIELSTRSIYANLVAIGDAFGMREGDVGLSWLPLYHDMGLHSCFFALMFHMPAVIMSPLEFLHRPSSWLKAIGRYRVTHSPAPNFGYSFAARRIKDVDLAGVDLSSWRVAMVGAEPIDAGVLTRFAERFAPNGFERRAFMGAYGLAENTVAVSFAPPQTGLRLESIDADVFAEQGEAIAATAGGKAMSVVSVGRVIDGHDVRIVRPEGGGEVENGRQGEIEVRGPSRMIGYRGEARATAGSFDGAWLKTGDLGYVRGDELFVTGRKKDLIIRGGRNVYPQDIEVAATVEGVRPGCVVAFGVTDVVAGTEDVVVVAEAKKKGKARGPVDPRIASRVRAAVQEATGLPLKDVAIVAPGAVPKTTSGKLRRAECKQRYLAGSLVPPSRPGVLLLAAVGVFSVLGARGQRTIERLARRLRRVAR
ncbi:MAG TPA: fatty acyl-AMP ligase [Polyangiaceae bacterium]